MIIIALGLLGVCMGSFVNALVWRIHKQETSKTKSQKYSITRGRSMCSTCQHPLAASDLIPLVSWVFLGGKCRYCHKPIGWQDPVIELSMLGLYLFSYAFWPYGFGRLASLQFGLWLVLLIGLLALVVYDLRWMILPNRLVYPLYSLAAVQIVLLMVQTSSFQPLIGAIGGALVVGGLFYLIFQVSKGKWIGGGDVKLGFILGIFAGSFLQGVLLLFIASLLGSLVSVPMLIINKKRGQQIPFGPFLIVATIIVYLFGTALVNWYKQQFLLI